MNNKQTIKWFLSTIKKIGKKNEIQKKLFKSNLQDSSERSEEDGLLIERILVLIRNVLQVPVSPETERRSDNDASLHDQVLWSLQEAGVLDLVLYIIGSEYESQYQLHALEIVCLLYREQVSWEIVLINFVYLLMVNWHNIINLYIFWLLHNFLNACLVVCCIKELYCNLRYCFIRCFVWCEFKIHTCSYLLMSLKVPKIHYTSITIQTPSRWESWLPSLRFTVNFRCHLPSSTAVFSVFNQFYKNF